MDEREQEQERQFRARADKASALAAEVVALFEHLRGKEFGDLTLVAEQEERSLFVTEVGFRIYQYAAQPEWPVFAKLTLSSRNFLVPRWELAVVSPQTPTIVENYDAAEAFVVGLIHRVREFSGRFERRSERRLLVRQKVQIPAVLIVPSGPIRVVVLNRTEQGVMIELPAATDLPDTLALELEGRYRPGQLAWQQDVLAGIRFV